MLLSLKTQEIIWKRFKMIFEPGQLYMVINQYTTTRTALLHNEQYRGMRENLPSDHILCLKNGMILLYLGLSDTYSTIFGGFPKRFLYNNKVYADSFGTFSNPEKHLMHCK